MGYLFNIVKRTNKGVESTTHYAHSNKAAHEERKRLVHQEHVIAVTPIIKSDFSKFDNRSLPLALNAIVKDAKKMGELSWPDR